MAENVVGDVDETRVATIYGFYSPSEEAGACTKHAAGVGDEFERTGSVEIVATKDGVRRVRGRVGLG